MKNNTQTRLGGFAMLEVLISILVIAFGLLGLAGLQGFSIRNNHNAYLRGQATLFAYDIADRIRANRRGFDNGNYSLGTAVGNYSLGTVVDTAACHPSGTPSGCSTGEMAGYDLFTWGQTLRQLPSGQGVVCIDDAVGEGISAAAPNCSGGTGLQYVVKIWFDENHNGTLTQFNVVLRP